MEIRLKIRKHKKQNEKIRKNEENYKKLIISYKKKTKKITIS